MRASYVVLDVGVEICEGELMFEPLASDSRKEEESVEERNKKRRMEKQRGEEERRKRRSGMRSRMRSKMGGIS